MIYLLDTNAWIAYLRQSNARLVQRFLQVAPADIGLSSARASSIREPCDQWLTQRPGGVICRRRTDPATSAAAVRCRTRRATFPKVNVNEPLRRCPVDGVKTPP